jgi:hypothetical protein
MPEPALEGYPKRCSILRASIVKCKELGCDETNLMVIIEQQLINS